MGKSVYDLILGVLDRLSADQLERFKHKLSEQHEIGFGLIEKESNMAVRQRIIDKFTKKDAIAHTATVLREIDQCDQAEDLEEAYARQGASSVAGMGDTGGRASDSSITQTEEPRTREDFLQYSCQLTLNPNTAFKRLRLSEGNREMLMRI
ncbi:hypothetical protein AAFF_G00355710 [Aldrovandia affinis]|uniref:Pyrin domain-containing protein n=1 Tax=Aldrovandia affinis TaxID=143900 RepID=A0AAD7R5G4_9TELE|nr:hypothetical protein AAFF_G00355710 [Aldrovandia affinis]